MSQMRLTGLMSGMDTESIIQQLVEGKKTKVDKTKKAQTKLQWKQDAWKSLNTKLQNLQKKYLGNMRFSDAYSKKTTKVSNPNAVSVITGEDAVNGVQSLRIKQLAKTGILTGDTVKGVDENGKAKKVTALSTLSELGVSSEGSINVSTGNTSVDIKVNSSTTISEVLTQLKNAGLNASFDEGNQRFFVSSKESGAASDFSISAMDANGLNALTALGLQENLGNLKNLVDMTDATKFAEEFAKLGKSQQEYVTYAKYYVEGNEAATVANMQSMIDEDVAARTKRYEAEYKSLMESRTAAQKELDKINDKYAGKTLESVEYYTEEINKRSERIAAIDEQLKDDTLDEATKKTLEGERESLVKEQSELTEGHADAANKLKQQGAIKNAEDAMQKVEEYIGTPTSVEENGETVYKATDTTKLVNEIADRYYAKAEFANNVVENSGSVTGGATKVNGQDAEIYLNDAKFTSTNNTFSINGLTFTALNETKDGEQITVTTEQDTDGIYDMVKNFLKEYNAIINEMDKLYNADSAKGYEPLTTEEKDALSDSEVEEYEKKIKDALLRRDENLSSVSSALKAVMSAGIEVGGKTMYLHSFGIETLGYFEAADNEKNAYHIAGDPDDVDTAGKADVLKGMIANDPDTVVSFFTKLSQNLYDKMTDMSKSVNGYRSFGTFYDDKKMKSDYDSYTTKIKEQEQKLNDYEDKWYKKFAAMESAMAKMQNSANAVTSLLGGS